MEVENGIDPLLVTANYLPEPPPANSTIPSNIAQLVAYPQGTYGNGKLVGGLRTPNNNKGYFYQNSPGNGENNTDNYGIPDTLNRIERVAKEWARRHPDLAPLKTNVFTTGYRDNLYTDDGTGRTNGIRIGTNDLSLINGGDHPDHNSHENGLDMDVWYMRKDNAEYVVGQEFAGVRVNDIQTYSPELSKELVKLFVDIGGAVQVFVNVNSHIRPEPGDPDYSEYAQIINNEVDHVDHFHVAFPNPNPPRGTIALTASAVQMEGGNYVCTVTSGDILDTYGMRLFDGFMVKVKITAGSGSINGAGNEINVPINNGMIAFTIISDQAGVTTNVAVTAADSYGQGQAMGQISVSF